MTDARASRRTAHPSESNIELTVDFPSQLNTDRTVILTCDDGNGNILSSCGATNRLALLNLRPLACVLLASWQPVSSNTRR